MITPHRLRLPSVLLIYLAVGVTGLKALDPRKAFTQYTRTTWTQAHGLPQDTVRRITQTSDGYLWLGTHEGLARFDGYDFTVFTKANGALASDSITWLAAGHDNTLWIGTSAGLSRFRDGRFTTFTLKGGLPNNAIISLFEDHAGILWVAAGTSLTRFDGSRFTTVPADRLPIQAVRVVYEDNHHALWVAGVGGLARLDAGNFVSVLGSSDLRGNTPIQLGSDHDDNLWITGTKGLISRAPDGHLRRFDSQNGLPDDVVWTFWVDQLGTVWAGTDGGLSRLERSRFVSSGLGEGAGEDGVRSLFEDREGDLWIGTNAGLSRLRDDQFTMFGRAEGLASDEPIVVHQDRNGNILVGYHNNNTVSLHEAPYRVSTTPHDRLGSGAFAIRDGSNGDLLVSTRAGLARVHGSTVSNSVLPDPLSRRGVFDALEDRRGRIWAAGPGGVYLMTGSTWRNIVPGGPVADQSAVVLAETSDGSIWAGTYGSGLWRITDSGTRQYTTADGLGGNEIRSLYADQDGALWVGTSGGGLNEFRDNVFFHYSVEHGLLSNNVAHIEDDRNGSLWLSTTRGICRIAKHQLADLRAGRIKAITPVNYGIQDGLRSAQCAPGYPIAGGGTRTNDGRLWFTTSRGIAVIDQAKAGPQQPLSGPVLQLLDVTADNERIDFQRLARLQPGTERVHIRYTGIHLSAPERVSYSHKLEGLDREWVVDGSRRTVDYDRLPHGNYRFLVQATLPEGTASEAGFSFVVPPHFYQRQFFLWLCAGAFVLSAYGVHQLRLKQIHNRFSLVLEERARMAREIHDTFAQGLIGVTRQLDAVAKRMRGKDEVSEQYLNLAQKMARYSLTEARRSIADLRAPGLEDGNLAAALTSSLPHWTRGEVFAEIDFPETAAKLSEDVEHNVLRIAQEAVTNAIKHADASKISIQLRVHSDTLLLKVKDNGCGFRADAPFEISEGHFGLIGMRERAERLGGKLDLSSPLGAGTEVTLSIPLASKTVSRNAIAI